MIRAEYYAQVEQIDNWYKNEIKKAQEQRDEKVFQLTNDCAKANNKVVVGDIVSDAHNTIKVNEMKVTTYPFPQMKYKGYVVSGSGENARLMPFQKEVYQSATKRINGKPYNFIF